MGNACVYPQPFQTPAERFMLPVQKNQSANAASINQKVGNVTLSSQTNENELCEFGDENVQNPSPSCMDEAPIDDNQEGASWVDEAYNALNSTTPDIAYEYAPKSFSLQTESTHDFINDNKLAFDSLPRTKDGKIDVNKIKSSLTKSTALIVEQNNQAKELMDYGIYKDAINDTDLLIAMLGPEVANVVTSLGGDYIPDWATNGISIFDMDLNSIKNILEEAGVDFPSSLEDGVDFLDIKKSSEIEAEIKAQEDGLAELQNFEIKNDEDAKEFLDKYLELTGTSFFCDKIDECDKLYKDEDSSEADKLKAYQKACGNSNSLTDAQKNNIMTNVLYDVGLKYLIPVAINKINHPVTKIISTALPTVIEVNETATMGCEDGQMANLRNLDYKTVVDILAEGAIDGLFVNLAGKINYGDGIGKKTAGRAIKTGIATAATYAVKAGIKAVTPNYSSWGKAALTIFVPGSGAFIDW